MAPFTPEDHLSLKYIKTKINQQYSNGIRRPIKNDLIWLLVDAIPVFGDKNQLHVICSFKDITIQKKLKKT
jgi:hypothetical protein